MICVSIARTRHKMMLAEHQALATQGAQLVELRLDWLQRAPDVARLIDNRPTPVVITCRRAQDRGKWTGTEEQRQLLLRSAIVAGVDYVDLEDDIAAKIPRYGKTKRIISHHNFEETPANLEAIYEAMCRLNPDVVKLVTLANSPADTVRMLKLVERAEIPTVGFCMGEFGVPSRVLCGRYGAPFSYATVSRDRTLAPGQLTFGEMRDLYRYDSITKQTRVFGVLGDPIGQSLSPLLHNSAFADRKLDAVYLPLRVPADVFDQSLNEFSSLGIEGYSVTIPHKAAALARVPATDELVQEIGAANTLYQRAGKWVSANTDYQGAMGALQAVLKPEETLDGKRVVMLGAGGAARAIGLGLVKAGAVLTVTSRTLARAKELAEELGVRHCTWENRATEYADVLINCTPVGMHPNVNESPYQAHWLRDELIVFDTVYNPEQTLLLKHAKERGCRVVSGLEMFIRQAAAQFEYFTGEQASLENFAQTLRRGISAAKLS